MKIVAQEALDLNAQSVNGKFWVECLNENWFMDSPVRMAGNRTLAS